MKQLTIIIILVLFGSSIQSQDLQVAVMTDNITELKDYVKKFGVNHPQSKSYPLLAATQYGRLELVKYLMENGADINARGQKQKTALMFALQKNYIEIATYLLSCNPDLSLQDNKGNSALEIAYKVHNFDAIKKAIPENPFICNDGPYIFKSKRSFKTVSIHIDKDGKPIKKIKKIKKAKKRDQPIKAACYNEKGEAIFEFELLCKFKTEKESTFEGVSKIVAISDIEGRFYEFTTLLQECKVMNESYQWTFGDGHLVLLGDFFDRGAQVTECLWLSYHLDQQAKKTGGKVHFIIGNHEEMNLSGDYRYVNFKYISNANFIGIDYKDFYNRKSILGKWLRSKNGIVKINGDIFVHGGLSPEFLEHRLSLNKINKVLRRNIDYSTAFQQQDPAAIHVFHQEYGPLWYRGLIKGKLQQDEVQKILDFYEGHKMIIGHSAVKEITPFYENKVIDIDVRHTMGIKESRALLIKDGHYYSVGKDFHKELIEL